MTNNGKIDIQMYLWYQKIPELFTNQPKPLSFQQKAIQTKTTWKEHFLSELWLSWAMNKYKLKNNQMKLTPWGKRLVTSVKGCLACDEEEKRQQKEVSSEWDVFPAPAVCIYLSIMGIFVCSTLDSLDTALQFFDGYAPGFQEISMLYI